MRQIPELKLIKIFTIIVKNKGFSNAQYELNLSTSALSTYMSQLETALDMKLCHRGRGGFSLTHKGELFYQEALRILQQFDQFVLRSAQIQGNLSGTLKIGLIDSIVSDTNIPLDLIIRHFSELYPHVYLRLQVQSPYELQLAVLEDRLDIAIGSFFSKMSGLIYHPLHQEQHWLYCSDQHPLFAQTELSTEHITGENMVNRGYWSQTELAKHGFQYSAATVESMEAQLILILSGKYIGYLPEHYAQQWVAQSRLKPLLPNTFGYQAPFSLITRRGRMKESILHSFKTMLLAKMQSKD
ncbi:LysR family transcriptional regulator [Acinetobacter calcoaceticus]|uniref:LysR family transcriptional regulator n=1 Tax=Acinetobacter calcoaceticus TaxID=471 RepID=A0A4R1XJW2_ACICA|nr:LysR family transcriptional regulator [Acinetobacter calcoaceticus]